MNGVRDVPEQSRYELVRDGQIVAIADYRVDGDRLIMPHTEVVPHLRGQGLGEELIRHALDDVRRRGHTVVPTCWFVAEFIEQNSDYGDLVA